MTVLPAVLAVLAVLLVLAAGAAVRAATRLDRLHRRTEAAWLALDGALVHRAVVVRTLAAAEELAADACGPLRAAAGRAIATGRDREIAENELSRMLDQLDRAALPAARVAELADAEVRVVIARRVYNDAVRDTRALRSRRAVRWLRLAGTAPWPRYFEIAEPATGLPGLTSWRWWRNARTHG